MTKIQKYLFLVLILASVSTSMNAQWKIGNSPESIDSSAILHLDGGGTKGLLLPRVSTANRDGAAGMLSPEGGIIFYNTTDNTIQISIDGGMWNNAETGGVVNTTTGSTTSIGKVGIGTNSPNASTILDIVSTTKGVLLPTATNDIPGNVKGMLYYNTTTNKVRFYNGTNWVDIKTN